MSHNFFDHDAKCCRNHAMFHVHADFDMDTIEYFNFSQYFRNNKIVKITLFLK